MVLLGSVPSIANGMLSGVDQIPPILLRVGTVLGAGRFASARHILLPAALPGYLSGLKQGWAFSWRSLMAAELIANSPQLGEGLGQYLQNGQSLSDMPTVIAAIVSDPAGRHRRGTVGVPTARTLGPALARLLNHCTC